VFPLKNDPMPFINPWNDADNAFHALPIQFKLNEEGTWSDVSVV